MLRVLIHDGNLVYDAETSQLVAMFTDPAVAEHVCRVVWHQAAAEPLPRGGERIPAVVCATLSEQYGVPPQAPTEEVAEFRVDAQPMESPQPDQTGTVVREYVSTVTELTSSLHMAVDRALEARTDVTDMIARLVEAARAGA